MSIYAACRRQRNSATYLFAEHGHSERSEESQHVEIVIHWPINTCERGKPYNRASPVENKQTALRALEMHPFWYLRYHLSPLGSMSLDSQSPVGSLRIQFFATPEGELLAVLCIEVLMSSEAERRANFPLRGKSPQGNRGAFPSGVSPVIRFSIPQSGIIKLIARRAIPPPSEPFEPFEPSEPFLPPQPFYTTHGDAVPPFFYLRRKPPPQPSAQRAVKLKNLRPPCGRQPSAAEPLSTFAMLLTLPTIHP